jgi:hypothetical protein
MRHEFSEYLEIDSSVPSRLRWTKQNGRIAAGDPAGTIHKNKKYYVIQYFGTKYNCDDVIKTMQAEQQENEECFD